MEVSIFSVTSTLLIGASCFAIGYILADSSAKTLSCNRFVSWMRSAVKGNNPLPESTSVASLQEAKFANDDDKKEEKVSGTRQAKTIPLAVVPLEIENLAEMLEDFKMVLVVRNDLKMGKGKIAAQCSHATLGLFKKLNRRAPKALARWELCGQVKVVLKIESDEELLVLKARAKSLKLPTHITIDAGRTQIAPSRIRSPYLNELESRIIRSLLFLVK
ncbi:putative peptidyl-tRNA hydrolase 2 isoform X2 [Wolffia australiana]